MNKTEGILNTNMNVVTIKVEKRINNQFNFISSKTTNTIHMFCYIHNSAMR